MHQTAQRSIRDPFSSPLWPWLALLFACLALATPPLHAQTSGLVPYLRNPGFEQYDANGKPLYWKEFRQGYVDHDAALAHEGDTSVRSSYLFGWSQRLLPPCPPYQTYAVHGYASAEFDFERVKIRSVLLDSNGNYLADLSDVSPLTTGTLYSEFWTARELPEGISSLELFLGGASNQSWLRFDDLRLFSEQFASAGATFGEPWQISDGVSETSRGLLLEDGASIWQRVATGVADQAYFVTGHFEASSPSSVTVSEKWLPRNAEESTACRSVTQLLAPERGRFVCDLARPAGEGPCSGLALVRLEAQTSGVILLSKLERGFAKVQPQVLTVGPGSPDKGLKLTAAWPDSLSSASIELRCDESTWTTSLAAQLFQSSARASWQPDDAPEGNYHARFHLVSKQGESLEVERAFRVVRQNVPSAQILPFHPGEFTRGAWLYMVSQYDPAKLERALTLAREDGFNFAVVYCRTDQFDQLRRGAQQARMPFVVTVPGLHPLFSSMPRQDYFSKQAYLDQVRQALAPILDSPYFQGVYVADEPSGEGAYELFWRVSQAISQSGYLKRAFSVFLSSVTPSQVALASPPALLVDVYPWTDSKPSSSAALLEAIVQYNRNAQLAAAQGREFWLVAQAFEEYQPTGFSRAVANTMHWAQLGGAVLAGARGVVPFIYDSLGQLEGLRGLQLEPLRKLAPYQRFNKLMERLGPLLLQLPPPQLDSRAPSPFALSSTVDSGGQRYVFVLNTDEQATQTLGITLAGTPPQPLTDLVCQRPIGLDGQGQPAVELGPGEWAFFCVGSCTVSALRSTPNAAPNLGTLSLAVRNTFVVRGSSGQPLPAAKLSFNKDATALAASVPFQLAPTPPRVYKLLDDGTAEALGGPQRWGCERVFFVSEDEVAMASPNLGFEVFHLSNLSDPPVQQFMGRSGGAYDLIETGSAWWASMFGFGIRRLQSTAQGLQSIAAGISDTDLYRDLFGPFRDGSVTTLVRDTSVSNIKADALGEPFQRQLELPRTFENASMNARLQLVVPLNQRGVALVQLSPQGEPLTTSSVALEATDACASAWVGDEVLAVADGTFCVRFYRVSASGASTAIGTWRPARSDAFYLRSLAWRQDKLAVGLQDGSVYVVDTGTVRNQLPAAAQDWSLFSQ